MSTGYTENIKNGVSFENFVLQCARAFGALVTLRDESLTSNVPNEIKPNNYHYDSWKLAKEKYKKYKKMSLKDAKELAKKEYDRRLEEYNQTINNTRDLEKKYIDMLRKVQNWKPPTKNHINLKNFMIEQIKDSMKFDCNMTYFNPPALLSPKEYKKEYLKMFINDKKYHLTHYKKEIKSCKEKTKWIQDLKKSLNLFKE